MTTCSRHERGYAHRRARPAVLSSLFVLLSLAVGAGPVEAQSITTGTLEGRVASSLDEPIHGALITATGRTTGFSWRIRSSRDGTFTLDLLPPGEYEVFVEALGYRPKRLRGVPVRPGRAVALPVTLDAVAPPVERIDTVRFGAAAVGGSRPGISERFSRFRLADLPDRERAAADLARASSRAASDLGVDGLPSAMTTLALDGSPFSPALHPGLGLARSELALAPRLSLSDAELLLNENDVEWAGSAGAVLAGYTRPGRSSLGIDLLGSWSGSALWSSRLFDDAGVSHGSWRAGGVVAAPVVPDTAHLAVGVEGWRVETPRAPAWRDGAPPSPGAGVSLAALGAPTVAASEALTGFARLDWQIGTDHALRVRANMASLPEHAELRGLPDGTLSEVSVEGTDVAASAEVTSTVTDRLRLQLRAGFGSTDRTYAPPGTVGLDGSSIVPTTHLVAEGIRAGGDPGLPGDFRRSTFSGTAAAHFGLSTHRFKGGLSFGTTSHESGYLHGRRGEFYFGEPAGGSGGEADAFVGVDGPAATADFTTSELGVFVQDVWEAAPGLDLLMGIRYDRESHPADEIRLAEEWLALTGLANTAVDDTRGKLSTRFSFLWDVAERGEWIVRGASGVFYGTVGPGVWSELLTLDGRTTARRRVGPVPAWPGEPPAGEGTVEAARLALPGPDLEAPRSTRGSIGITRILGPGTALHLSGSFRRTEFLPRRKDLNLSTRPVGEDQFGRPVYGDPVRVGRVLAAEPGSNRRFADFDFVYARDPDGWSEYRSFTATLERKDSEALELFASYTYSETEDNWPSAGLGHPGSHLDPFPGAAAGGDDWTEGTSDLDVPHRLVAGWRVGVPGVPALHLSGLYRLRSALPFTPGFPVGVDANGDGSFRNDPAYVPADGSLGALAREWDCLREQAGGFAERNACRGSPVHELDLRASVSIHAGAGYTARLVVDALNVLEPRTGPRNAALFELDPAGALTVNPETGEVTVPLTVNPDFGRIVRPDGPGRILRIGVEVTR